jgi:LacI family transcriptional regulator
MSRLELARAAVTALREHVENTNPRREYKIDTKLVVRESTGYPRGTMQDLQSLRASGEPAKTARHQA